MPVGEIDILEFSRELHDVYCRYIYTTHNLTDQDPDLQDALFDKVTAGHPIVRGPLVHCTPYYRAGSSLSELVAHNAGNFSPRLLELGRAGFDVERPLYSHQIESI